MVLGFTSCHGPRPYILAMVLGPSSCHGPRPHILAMVPGPTSWSLFWAPHPGHGPNPHTLPRSALRDCFFLPVQLRYNSIAHLLVSIL
ncbi:hypothetical protein Bpfe_012152 [Biomphalaria pfeifferi]|uniref:Uncharacterized protein n=1 Tax=Biomphalaria pfeifferi TaxID=112525 RepID=A0AAD8BPR1_BIOPF|nr:hypothetical protein Bpfe_012152 [Biomphalaria pfeifferi]